jgi:hypothetical protein
VAKKTSLIVSVRIEGVRDTLAAFRKLPKDANTALRKASLTIAEAVATEARAGAVAEGAQAALLAPTVKAVRDRVPAVQAGGTKRVGRKRAPAYKLLFAAEFGMNRRSGWYSDPRFEGSEGRQFKPHQGQKGLWFFPSVEAQQSRISREWNEAADEIIQSFEG